MEYPNRLGTRGNLLDMTRRRFRRFIRPMKTANTERARQPRTTPAGR